MQESGRWFRTGSCWCRKVVAGSGLVVAGAEQVVAGICWCRKVVVGAGLVITGVCWCRKVVTGSGVVVAGAELVSAGAGKWSLVQDWYLLVQNW